MSGFSTAAITSACEAIAHRALSTSTELDSLLGANADPGNEVLQQLREFQSNLRHLKETVEELKESLAAASVVAQGPQNALHASIHPASDASAVVEKRIRSIQVQSIGRIDADVLTEYLDYQEANTRLFSFFSEVLQLPSLEDQEEKLSELMELEDAGLLERALETSQVILASNAILRHQEEPPSSPQLTLDTTQEQHSPPDNDKHRPPEYSPEEDTSKPGPSSGGFFASLTNSFQAIAAGMRPKPEPMVIAMCQSARVGNLSQLKGFIDQGANINGKNEEGYTPLICAIRTNQPAAVQFLIHAGADPNQYDSYRGKRKPPLFHAAELGYVSITNILLKDGADVKERSWSGQPFFVDVACGENLDIIRCFLEHGADANMVSMSGRSILTHAVRSGSLEHLKLLAEYGGDVNARDINGRPALHTALGLDRVDMIEFLLQKGADPNILDITGTGLLIASLQKKNYDLVKMLLIRGANPNVSGLIGKPLIVMVIENTDMGEDIKTDLIRLLLKKGVDPNRTEKRKTPLLSHVMTAGNTSVLRIFLENGAKANGKMKSQETFLLYSLDRGRTEQVNLLLKYGADPNKSDDNGRTPLIEALQLGDPRLVKQLLAAGANANQSGQITPLALAKLSGNAEAVKMLMARGATFVERPSDHSASISKSSSSGPAAAESQQHAGPSGMPPPYSGNGPSRTMPDNKG